MRTSQPYKELTEGITAVQAGERRERDDGWWRVMVVTIWNIVGVEGSYRSEVEWVPVETGTHEFVCATPEEVA